MFIIVLVFLLFTPAVFAQETASPQIWQENHASIGINSFLLNEPATVNFKKWNDNNKGHQIIIGNEIGQAGNKDLQKIGTQSDEAFETQIPSVEYACLKRTEFAKSNTAYVYTGYGLSFAGYYLHLDREDAKIGKISANLRFPIGIEHFPVKSMPFLSYSVEADFYAGFLKTCYDPGNRDDIGILFSFGVTPRFFVNWYFK
ncbi:MAG: hypothetical protein A3J83_07290 [Elusimicrobia bacterium RIFOXYA2_FULL_40_6]|nr:MAG: hypothetical protein A3J83_07290 [Elusimicrobia bacterium RIFOXYA2_FULL_40_6]